MKTFLLAVALAVSLGSLAWADQPVVYKRTPFSSVTADTSIDVGAGGRALYWRINWYPVGAPAACTVAVDSSLDNSAWSAGNVIAGQTCTTPGSVTTGVAASYNYVRMNVTALSANKSVVVVITGFEVVTASLAPAVINCSLFPGADAGAKISACITALPSAGGIANAQALSGTQTFSTDFLSGVTKQVVVLLGAGTYTSSVGLTVPANVQIVGLGQQLTTVAFNAQGAAVDGFTVQWGTAARIQGMTVSQTGAGRDCIRMRGGNMFTLQDLYLTTCGRDGVHIEPGANSEWAEKYTLANIRVSAAVRDGYRLELPATLTGTYINVGNFVNVEARGDGEHEMHWRLTSDQAGTQIAGTWIVNAEFDAQNGSGHSTDGWLIERPSGTGTVVGASVVSALIEATSGGPYAGYNVNIAQSGFASAFTFVQPSFSGYNSLINTANVTGLQYLASTILATIGPIGINQLGATSGSSLTVVGNQDLTQFSATSITSVIPQTAGGAKTCTYKIVANYGTSTHVPASAAVSTADCADDLTAANHGNVIVWPVVSGPATTCDVFRTVFTGTTPGGAAATGKIASPNCSALTYTDAGANGDASTPSAANTTGSFTSPSFSKAGTFAVDTTVNLALPSGGVGLDYQTAGNNLLITNGAGATQFYNHARSTVNVGINDNATVDMTGRFTTYNNVATVGVGAPSFTGQKLDTGFHTTQASANILAASVAVDQQYRVGYDLWQITSGSGGVCNTNATATVAIGWTDPASQAHTFTETAVNIQPTLGVGTAQVHGGAATGYQSDAFNIMVKASTAITRTITWVDGNCTTQPTATGKFWAEAVN